MLPEGRYLVESLSTSILVLVNLTLGKSFLPGGAYPMAES
jgi:hypothetical protein